RSCSLCRSQELLSLVHLRQLRWRMRKRVSPCFCQRALMFLCWVSSRTWHTLHLKNYLKTDTISSDRKVRATLPMIWVCRSLVKSPLYNLFAKPETSEDRLRCRVVRLSRRFLKKLQGMLFVRLSKETPAYRLQKRSRLQQWQDVLP